ncbi:MAG: B12-binding domain-containing radical SAM protein [Magnetococcales bacterium]|nr:B12-binding domain-containing radical SAM protein [Magnetococcales bacterium]
MSAVLINPNLVVQKNDTFTTGIIYMPVGLASIAAVLGEANIDITVIDSFGVAPKSSRVTDKFMLVGLSPKEVVELIPHDAKSAFVSANQLINHMSVVEIISTIKKHRPELPVVVLENSQAVTAYALKNAAKTLFKAGADFLLLGDGEAKVVDVVKWLAGQWSMDNRPNIHGFVAAGDDVASDPPPFIEELDSLPFPAWELFPLENYWSMGFSHGPLSSKRYLPLLTSRGCPFPCKFCVIPATSNRKWRARSAKNVVDEMAHWREKLQVEEFHIEDVNPTIQDKRIRAMCHEIIERRLPVTWKIAAGTKVESIRDIQSVELMARAGCKYVSISPESGSAKVLKLMGKPFNLEHAAEIIKAMSGVNIHTQACFVLGFPGEDEEDREMTWNMVKKLTKLGVDEIGLFIVTPVPGSEIFAEYSGYDSFSDLNFTPTWRDDYAQLADFRMALYKHFLFWKLLYHPLKIVKQCFNFLRRRFDTKMEMVPYKAIVWKRLQLK